jgi:hypothetical protein
VLSRLGEAWARAPWLVLAGLVVLLLAAARMGAREDAWYATGYVDTAKEMIDSGYVRLDCDSMRITTHFPRGSAQERWFSLSYLREDVRRFNSDPERVPGPFLVETDQECRLLGVDRYYHRIDLPYNRLVDWQGDVLLSGGHTSALLESRSIPQSIHIRPPESTADAARSWEASPQQPGVLPPTAFFRMRPWSYGPVVSELYFVGQDLVLADRRDEGAPFDIRVGGYPLLPGRVVRIETGDWVQLGFRRDAGRVRPETEPRLYTYLARVGSDSRLASFVRVQNDDVDRLFPIPHLQPFLEPFAQAMSSTVQNSAALRARGVANGQDSVVLTLDQGLGDALHARTLAWCRQNTASEGLRAVSMLVMDALSGAVRAIPSCPSVDQADALAGLSPAERERWLRNQNLVRHPIGSAGKPFWAVALASANPNLLDLQVPEHPGGEVSRALGCPLPAGYEDHAHSGPGGWVGMEGFLAASCNAYIVEMATGALALGGARTRSGGPCSGQLSAADFATCFPAPRAGDSVAHLRVCDQLVRTVLLPGTQFTGPDCNQLKQVGTDFDAIQNLFAVTNAEWYYRGAPAGVAAGAARRRGAQPDTAAGETLLEQGYRYGRYRIDVWRRITDAFAAVDYQTPPVESRLRFAAVSPEQTNLSLNALDQLRGEWINVLLGGSTSRWSNFQLAEAMARLMSGRAVQGEFVDSVQGRWIGATASHINARREFGVLPPDVLHPGARRRVLHGMELVVEQGTARLLQPLSQVLRDSLERAPGGPYDLYVFAKTGTPNVAKRVPSAGQRFVERLAPHLRWDAGARRIVPTSAGARMLADAARNTPRVHRWFEREVRAPLEANPEYFHARSDEDAPPHPLYLAGNGLRLNRRKDREVLRQGGVLVLGLMVVPRARGRAAAAGQVDWVSACSLDPALRSRILQVPRPEALDPGPTVALSVAIFVDDLDIGQGSGKAVELAAAAFPELQTYVLSQVRERVRRSIP